jgi:hypothetical protein
VISLERAAGKRGIRFVSGAFESFDKEARVVRAGGQELA